MIKGVNKNVIEINNTGNAYFEKAVLYVNPNFCCRDSQILKAQANKYLATFESNKPVLKNKNRARFSKKQKYFLIALLVTVAIGAAIILL